jgi:hypothetical protein
MKELFLKFIAVASSSIALFFFQSTQAHASTSAVFTPSRTEGVAPLSVFFDAASTTATGVTNPFHELDYAWDFGDTGAGVWTYGTASTSKNVAYGPVTAHVFETPGTYTVTLAVFDGSATVSETVEITVTNPNTVFAGENTICFTNASTTENFIDCPSGAFRVATTTFDGAVNTYLGTGKRLLFHRGETFTSDNTTYLDQNGPWTVGAYGTGAKPIVHSTRTSGWITMISIGSGTNGLFLSDGRLMDLALDAHDGTGHPLNVGTATTTAIGNRTGTFDQMLILRVDCSYLNNGFSYSGSILQSNDHTWDQITLQDSTTFHLEGQGGNSAFMAAKRMAILGNSFDNDGGAEHNFRSMYWNKLVISHNRFANPNTTKANITLRAPNYNEVDALVGLNAWSEYAFVSDNEMTGSGASLSVGTYVDSGQGDGDHRMRHTIFERNWWHDQPGSTGLMNIDTDYATVRNNIFNSLGGSRAVNLSANNNPLYNAGISWVYNNSVFTTYPGDAWGDWVPLRILTNYGSATFANNLVYSPNATGNVYIPSVSVPSGPVTISSNSTSTQAKGSSGNPFPVSSPTLISDFIPTTGSYALNYSTTTVPVYRDFYGNLRSGRSDIGAFILNSSFTDLVPPFLGESTPIGSTTDTTPAYTFTTTESGTIAYSGSCTSATTNATLGSNTITLSTLAIGTYSDCTITVEDSSGNVSTPLTISSFTITTASSGGGGGGGGGSSSKKKVTTTATTTPTTSSDPEIQRLLTLLAQLRAQLALLLGKKQGTTPVSTITRDLELGMEGEDVRTLQKYLNTHGYIIAQTGPGSPNNETTRFGPATHQAVIRYQNAHLTALGIRNGTGYVGVKTRGVMGW